MMEMNRHAFSCGALLADWIRDQPSARLEDTGHSLSPHVFEYVCNIWLRSSFSGIPGHTVSRGCLGVCGLLLPPCCLFSEFIYSVYTWESCRALYLAAAFCTYAISARALSTVFL